MVIVQGKMTNLNARHVCVRSKTNRLRSDKIFTLGFALLNYKKVILVVNISTMTG
jgi:hypothetical protein